MSLVNNPIMRNARTSATMAIIMSVNFTIINSFFEIKSFSQLISANVKYRESSL